MSRIGKIPVPVPAGVDVTIDGSLVTVKGPKGTLTHNVAAPIVVEKGEGTLEVARPNDERLSKSLHGLSRMYNDGLAFTAEAIEDIGLHAARLLRGTLTGQSGADAR